MASDPSTGIREFVEERVQRALAERLGTGAKLPDTHVRAIVDEALEAGRDEVDYVVRNLVRDAERAHRRRLQAERREEASREIARFGLFFRSQHIVLASSVLLLIATGIPIKFHESWLGNVVGASGLVDTMRVIHRVAAAALALVSIVHIVWVIFTREGWTNFLALIPRPQDLRDFLQMARVLLGRAIEKPRFGRFNFVEKFDYWAVYWGVVIMVGTGTLLAFNTYFMNLLGQYSMQIAKLIHSDEALLASLALLIWHLYWSHLNPDKFPMNRTFLTGTMTLDEMIEEHPAELEEKIKRGEVPIEMLEEHPEWRALHPDGRRAASGASKEEAPA